MKTLVQQLTAAIIALANNLDDAAAAATVANLAAQVAPLWVQADKSQISLSRSALVNAWIIQAGTSPKLAAAEVKAAPAALLTLMLAIDKAVIDEAGWVEYAKGGDVVPGLDEVAKAAGIAEPVDPQAKPAGVGAAIALGVGILGALALGALVVSNSEKKRKRRRAA